jgi:hypothetical protein
MHDNAMAGVSAGRGVAHAFIPADGSRASVRAQETGAIFQARQLLEQHDCETADKSKVQGVPLIVSGATDWTDVDVIFKRATRVDGNRLL